MDAQLPAAMLRAFPMETVPNENIGARTGLLVDNRFIFDLQSCTQ
jgi:hypothetical protein